MMASKKNGTLYIGVTTNLLQRAYQHKEHMTDGFTADYDVDKLVYFETYDDLEIAIAREKQLKKWNRVWKIQLIEKENPDWKDLFNTLI